MRYHYHVIEKRGETERRVSTHRNRAQTVKGIGAAKVSVVSDCRSTPEVFGHSHTGSCCEGRADEGYLKFKPCHRASTIELEVCYCKEGRKEVDGE